MMQRKVTSIKKLNDEGKWRVLVTGGTGFLGRNLIKQLIRAGCEVHAVVRPVSSRGALDELCGSTVHVHDGKTSGIIDILQAVKPQIVFHLASRFVSNHTHDQLFDIISSNVIFGTQLLEAMRATGVRKLINTGSYWQCSTGSEYLPVNLYAASKQAFEDIIAFYVADGAIDATTLVLTDTYGVGDPRRKLVGILRQRLGSGEILDMSPGDQEVDLVYVSDVINAFICAAMQAWDSENFQRSYIVATGSPVKVRQLVQIFEEISGSRLNVRLGRLPYRNREIMKISSALEPVPGWTADISLREGLEMVIKG